jgi:type III pantothenate kinase
VTLEPDPDSLLAIDAGNTRIKWGVFDGHKWNPSGALPTAESPRLAEVWNAVPEGIRAIASNVAGGEVQADLERACAAGGHALATIQARPAQLGVTNAYRDPRQLGPDRWAGLVAAHHRHPGHKLVVNAGTALTIDALRADGQFVGGLIVAGPALMRRSLDRATAGLRLTEGHFEPLPTSTPDAITTGAIQACAGAIERMRDVMAGRGMAPELVILSGGAAAELGGHLLGAVLVEEHLVLDGLVRIAGKA